VGTEPILHLTRVRVYPEGYVQVLTTAMVWGGRGRPEGSTLRWPEGGNPPGFCSYTYIVNQAILAWSFASRLFFKRPSQYCLIHTPEKNCPTLYVVNQAISAWSALSICRQRILNDQANIAWFTTHNCSYI
jgi:hypothetical protein